MVAQEPPRGRAVLIADRMMLVLDIVRPVGGRFITLTMSALIARGRGRTIRGRGFGSCWSSLCLSKLVDEMKMKVLFDALCRAVENNESLREVRPYVEKARLFHLDVVPHEFLSKTLDEIRIEDHVEDFFLPFPVVAVEDRASVLVAADTIDGQRGLKGERVFLEYIDCAHEREGAFCDGDKGGDEKLPPESAIIIMTVVDDYRLYRDGVDKLRSDIHGILGVVWYLEADRVVSTIRAKDLSDEAAENLTKAALKNCIVCFEELLHVNNPSRFILERRPIKNRAGAGKNGRIPRTNERPVYTILEPGKIRQRLGLAEGEGSQGGRTVTPHERRAFFRSYKADKWVNMKGKRIVIGATWVGPSEAKVGNHLYRVLLDK